MGISTPNNHKDGRCGSGVCATQRTTTCEEYAPYAESEVFFRRAVELAERLFSENDLRLVPVSNRVHLNNLAAVYDAHQADSRMPRELSRRRRLEGC
jgi:hypothetical protein